jgi:hypothetical protein
VLKRHPEVSFEPVVGGDEASSNDCDKGDGSDEGDNVEHQRSRSFALETILQISTSNYIYIYLQKSSI